MVYARSQNLTERHSEAREKRHGDVDAVGLISPFAANLFSQRPAPRYYTIESFVAAMSRASTSGVSLAYAFFVPSGLCAPSVLAFPLTLPKQVCPSFKNPHIAPLALDSPSRKREHIPNQRINLHALDVVQLLQRLLDLPLIRLHVADEHQRVILLNLLHGALRVQRVDDDLVGVEARLVRDRFAWVFGGAGQLECFGPVEGRAEADFADFFGVNLWARR